MENRLDVPAVPVAATAAAASGYNPGQARPVLRTLRELRHDRGWSLRDLANSSGLDRAIISQIERGRLVATTSEAAQLATALDLPTGSLTTRTVLAYEDTTA